MYTLILTMCVAGWGGDCASGVEFVNLSGIASKEDCASLSRHYSETMKDHRSGERPYPGEKWVKDARCVHGWTKANGDGT